MARTLRKNGIPIKDRRLVRILEGADYYAMGISSFRKWAESVGALKKIGNITVADTWILNEDLNNKGRMNGCEQITNNGHSDR